MKIRISSLDRLRQRLPVMANSGMSDSELEDGQTRWARRAIRSAIVLVLVLVFEAALSYRFTDGRPTLEVWLFVISGLLVAATVGDEIVGDLMADGFRSIADTRAKERLGAAETAAAEANERAAQADLKRAELETKLQPRQTDQKQFDLVQTLRGRLEQVSIVHEADVESRWYASSLRDAFWAADIKVGMFTRAVDVHSAGILIYDPGMQGAKKSEIGDILVDLFRGREHAVMMISGPPIDVPLPFEYPAIIVGGRFPILPPHIAKAMQMADAAYAHLKRMQE